MTDTFADIEAYLVAHEAERRADLVAFLRIPSISALPEHAGDVAAAAAWLAARMRAIGLDHVEVSPTGGHPVVYGDWLGAPGRPTVLVYGHYDVQPVDPLALWATPPFEPRLADGRIYARGAADDKGQVHLHLAAVEAWLATRGRLPLNLRFVFEGEEEWGSQNLDAWLEANRGRLGADLVVISDTGFFEGNRPEITTGLRGITYFQVDVSGPDRDLHSGGFGGVVRNPANALAAIIAGLHDADGRVAVAGFYDGVRELDARERAATAALPFDEAAFAASIGVAELPGEAGYSVLERRGARPTLDVNGLWGGFQGEGAKTIIPAEAHAKISCRLVPDQDPQQVFEAVRARILALAPSGVRVTISQLHNGRPSLTPIDHPATQAAARALEAVFGEPPLYAREGGSIPVVASFETILGLSTVLLGFANPDDRAHAPNESFRLANYEGGVRTVVRYWHGLAETIR